MSPTLPVAGIGWHIALQSTVSPADGNVMRSLRSGRSADSVSRENELAALRARFTRRWVTGLVVGYVIVAINWFGYRLASQDVLDQPGIPTESVSALHQLREVNAALTLIAIFVLALLALAFFRPIDRTLRRETRKVASIEEEQARETALRRFDGELHEALEMAPDELSVNRLVRHVFQQVVPDHPAELLLADSSDAHLTVRADNPSAGRAGCGVSSPFDCPAVRRARALTFESSTVLNACPHLRDRDGGPRSAHCVPLSFMGRSLGVLHVTGADKSVLDDDVALRLGAVASQVGAHLGTVRAFATAQIQASTDSLTGLPNRRSVEDELAARLAAGETISIAIADLDNFKLLNDAYGHEAGDRALRLFADTVRKALRAEDLFARWGGEEFVIALPGMRREAAVDVLDRARFALVDACARAETPPITASFGVVDTSLDRGLDSLLRAADEGLFEAKRAGKDQVCLGPLMDVPLIVQPDLAESDVADDATLEPESAQASKATVIRS